MLQSAMQGGMAAGEDLEYRKDLNRKEFFRVLSDSRSSKLSPKHPEFKYKLTKEPMWMHSYDIPPWITHELIRNGVSGEPQCIRTTNIPSVADSLSPSLIWACCKSKDLSRGTVLHNELLKRSLAEKNYSDALITLYAKCGELQKAQKLLDLHNSSSIIPWTALIAGYARQGKGQNALDCFEQMQREGIPPDAVTYACILKACALVGAIDKGKQIHKEILRQGLLEHHLVVGNALIDMYAKCGALSQAQSVLKKLPSRDVISWSALIAGYVQNRQGQQALECFDQMKFEGIPPNVVTYVLILKACALVRSIDKGNQFHHEILREGFLEQHVMLGNALVDMYAKCDAFPQARSVLEKLPFRNVVSWSPLITRYAQNGQGQQALECFEQMQREGVLPDGVTYACILKACAAIRLIDKGKQIHDEIFRHGLLEHDVVLGNALVDMYAKCGALPQAQSVLEKLPLRDVFSWNALIAGYAQNAQGEQALECFKQMQHEGIPPNAVTYVCMLKACALIRAIDKGKRIHDEILKQGLLEHEVALGNALIDMYAKCGDLPQAQSVLNKLPSRDVVSWSTLIAGYVEHGQGWQAVECFEQMQLEGCPPDAVTYVCILKACAVIGAIDKGKKFHDEIWKQGLLERNLVVGNALVDMYAKCGDLLQAQSILKSLSSRDVISWSVLIAGYVQNGQGQQALECFELMQQEGISPNAITYLSILKACAVIGAIDKGKQIHDEISRQGLLVHDLVVGNALVDMYAKCGALCLARSVLEMLPSRNVVSWSTLISGYAQNGQSQQALECFEQMKCEGILPNSVTFHCLLNLCSHLGLVEKGQELLDSMEPMYGLKPDIECFTCMVDLLGRAGHLVKALEIIQGMPYLANSSIWHCLLGACLKWVNVNLGRWAFQQAVELDECDGAAYVLMVNIYAAARMPAKAKDIESMRIKNKAWKLPDPNYGVLEFSVDDAKFAQSTEVSLKLETIVHELSQQTCFPSLSQGPRNMPDASKVHFPSRHYEKMAIPCALIQTFHVDEIAIR